MKRIGHVIETLLRALTPSTSPGAITNNIYINRGVINMQVFTIRDNRAEAHLAPFYSHNNATAMRQFEEACRDNNGMIAKHPEDYALFHIGAFDEFSGRLEPSEPVFLINALQLMSDTTEANFRNDADERFLASMTEQKS